MNLSLYRVKPSIVCCSFARDALARARTQNRAKGTGLGQNPALTLSKPHTVIDQMEIVTTYRRDLKIYCKLLAHG